MALKRDFRIKKEQDFTRVFKRGRVVKDSVLLLREVANTLPYTRIGIIVSAKISKSAVVRNRMRRKVSETVRLMYNRIVPGKDIVFSVQDKNIQEETITDLVHSLLQKAHLLTK